MAEMNIEIAKEYINKLARGINPLDDSILEEDCIINDINISRALFCVCEELNKKKSFPYEERKDKPFYLSSKDKHNYVLSGPKTISRIAEAIDAIKPDCGMKKITYQVIANWLIAVGLLQIIKLKNDKTHKIPTEDGKKIGIMAEKRTSEKGNEYEVYVLDNYAQRIILRHINDMNVNLANNKNELEWTDDVDKELITLYRRNISLNTISLILKRTNEDISNRLNVLSNML